MVPIHTNFNITVFSLFIQTQNIYFKKYLQPPNGSHPHKLQQYKSIIYIKSKHWCRNNGNIHTNSKINTNQTKCWLKTKTLEIYNLQQYKCFPCYVKHEISTVFVTIKVEIILSNSCQVKMPSESEVGSSDSNLWFVSQLSLSVMKEVHVHISQATHTFRNSGLCALDVVSCYSNFWLSRFWLLPATSMTIVCLLMLLAWQALRQTKQF